MAKTRNGFGIEICKVIGLDPNNVRKITLTSEATSVDVVEIEYYATEDLLPIIKKFEMVPVDG